MKFLVVFAALVVACSARQINKRGANGDQQPRIWDALKQLRGGKDLTVEDMQNLYANAVAGQDYPVNSVVPEQGAHDCAQYAQPGFYADDSSQSRCQIFYRCDENGLSTAYLCPNMSLFNQITLICDWFYNIDCSKSKQFENYSNSRLNQENLVLLDDQMEIMAEAAEASGAVQKSSVSKKSGGKKSKKSKKSKAKAAESDDSQQ